MDGMALLPYWRRVKQCSASSPPPSFGPPVVSPGRAGAGGRRKRRRRERTVAAPVRARAAPILVSSRTWMTRRIHASSKSRATGCEKELKFKFRPYDSGQA